MGSRKKNETLGEKCLRKEGVTGRESDKIEKGWVGDG